MGTRKGIRSTCCCRQHRKMQCHESLQMGSKDARKPPGADIDLNNRVFAYRSFAQ